jgi:hypothetical protein
MLTDAVETRRALPGLAELTRTHESIGTAPEVQVQCEETRSLAQWAFIDMFGLPEEKPLQG